MKNSVQYVSFALLVTLSLSACFSKKTAEIAPSPTPASLITQKNLFKDVSSAETPYRLYKLLAVNPTNINVSPLSLNMAFAQVYLAANEPTKELLQQIFGFKEGKFSFASELALTREKSAAKIFFANSVWVKSEKMPSVLMPYKQDLSKYLEGTVQKLDLKALNTSVSTATDGKIKTLVEKLNPNWVAVFVNALYFKADWTNPFKTADSRIDNFRSSEHLVVNAEMMNQIHEFKYYEDKTSQWVVLPYQDTPLEMVIGLPKKEDGLKAFEETFTAESVAKVIAGLKTERVELALPKFKFQSNTSLKNTFVNAGYSELFQAGTLDNLLSNSKTLGISEVIQATAINVDEKGTEAAAATAVGSVETFMDNLVAKKFKATHPFVFVIRNSKSGEVYFLGRVLNPLD